MSCNEKAELATEECTKNFLDEAISSLLEGVIIVKTAVLAGK